MGEVKITCEECKFAILQDTGYSNYTVEGTDFICTKGLNPHGSFDKFYGEDARLEFASQCPSFIKGDAIYMDVDQEGIEGLSEEQAAIWKEYTQ